MQQTNNTITQAIIDSKCIKLPLHSHHHPHPHRSPQTCQILLLQPVPQPMIEIKSNQINKASRYLGLQTNQAIDEQLKAWLISERVELKAWFASDQVELRLKLAVTTLICENSPLSSGSKCL